MTVEDTPHSGGEEPGVGPGGVPVHQRLGRELELFGGDPLIGAGLPFWLPDGAAVRHAVEEYVRELERLAGYRHVCSPVLGRRELYERSGHWEHFRTEMFPPTGSGSEAPVLRPVLCPHHALVFRSRGRSHRELPLRIAELGAMVRAERSGVLGGLTRVRAVQLNDAHVFCTPEQVGDEVSTVLDLVDAAYRALGVRPARFRLSRRDSGGGYAAHPDDPGLWERSEAAPSGGAGGARCAVRRGARGGGVLRSEDRRPGGGRGGTRGHALDGAGGLPPAQTFRAGVHRAGRVGATAGDGGPQRGRRPVPMAWGTAVRRMAAVAASRSPRGLWEEGG